MTQGSSPPKAARKRSPRRAGRHPTIADVSREAGVSPMTVSRVINGEATVAAATRARVDEAIARIGYVPNQAARALAGARQVRIAVLHDNPSAAWLSELLVGCLAQAATDNVQILIQSSFDHPGPGLLAGHLARSRVDGVILPPPLADDEAILAALRATGIAFVQVAAGRPAPGADSVRIDDFEAARAMTRHIIAKGHRRIGFIRGNGNQTASALRFEGYQAALSEAGIADNPLLVAQGDFSWRSGQDAAGQLIALADPPTAIFACNDDMAAATVAAAQRRGLDVPGRLAVFGFDDTAIAATLWPGLTTMRQPVADMARGATDILIQAVRAAASGTPQPPRHQVFPFTLVERESG